VDRTENLEHTLELMAGEERHRYSVAWLDLLADTAKTGRAVLSRADPWPAEEALTTRRAWRSLGPYPDALLRRPVLEVPTGFPAALLRPAALRAFNSLRWHAAPRRERQRPVPLAPYFFPLDGLGEWNRLYGPAGLLQYQLVVPLRRRRLPVYLAVLKRLGPAFGGPLSFPLEGWTLAIDLPAAASGLREALDQLDDVVAGCGGRVYLTKDARMRPDALGAMYPELDRFHVQRAEADPNGVLCSDLARRLGLCGAAG
jgi:decaprenylphospho-beta-D-ribofuranose 2-oxidase